MGAQDLLASALKLDPSERFALVEDILHSLDQPDPRVEALWAQEAQRRVAVLRRGEATLVPAQDVVGEL